MSINSRILQKMGSNSSFPDCNLDTSSTSPISDIKISPEFSASSNSSFASMSVVVSFKMDTQFSTLYIYIYCDIYYEESGFLSS